jgi:hypothetical protein
LRLTRRRLLRDAPLAAAALASAPLSRGAQAASRLEPPVPFRTITRGPRFHWFGYYDKLEFDASDRFVLANEVDFEHRTPRPDDAIVVGMVDTAEDDRWVPLGESRAWGWQQGCMLQWRPGSASEVLWNDREGDRFVCRLLDVHSRRLRTLPRAIYAASPDGRFALCADFARIQHMRPGYGYQGLPDPAADEKAPADSGVWRMDLESGEAELILSLAQVAALPHEGGGLEDEWHYFNHLLVSPDAKRLVVLHRWRGHMLYPDAVRSMIGFTTRMLTADVDGSELYVLDPSGHTSHFVWRDPRHVCAWTRPEGQPAGFYLFEDRTRNVEAVGAGVMTRNGHNTYLPLPGREWILNDTYPDFWSREQTPYLYHVPSRRRFDLGRFRLPWAYWGEWRCDLHPRSSNDGRSVAIDSPHLGHGRQVHLLDVSGIVDG